GRRAVPRRGLRPPPTQAGRAGGAVPGGGRLVGQARLPVVAFPHPPAPSPKEGEGEPEQAAFGLPLSPPWERGLGGGGAPACPPSAPHSRPSRTRASSPRTCRQ